MDIMTLIVQLVSGALGGNVAGSLFKDLSLGTAGNSIAGIVGGGIGGQILTSLFHMGEVGGGALDPAAIISQIAGGGVGGGILMVIAGIVRNMMAKQ
jgi:hypothetical protein